MTSTQKFEGPDMAALLDEVHAQLGPNARVIAANRRRSGGVAGFFARESFEVTVEVPEPEPVQPTTGRKRRRTTGSAAVVGSVGEDYVEPISIDPNDSRSALEQLIDAADRADELAQAKAARRQMANTGARSESAQTGTGAQPSRSDSRSTTGSRNVSGAARRTRAQRDTEGTNQASTTRANDDANAARHSRTLDFAAVLDRAEYEHTTTSQAARGSDGNDSATRSAEKPSKGSKSHKVFRRRNKARPVEEPVVRIIDLSSLEEASGNESLAPLAVSPKRVTKPETSQESAKPYIPRGDVPASDLSALGVPPQWLTGAINGRVLIDSVVSRIPSPPPIVHAPGVILAFVGEGEMCLNTARAVAVALKQDPANCVFLSPGERPAKTCVHIKAIDELAIRRASWVQEDHVTVVAIDAGFARPDVAWGRHAISILHPSMRWGVVSATRKVEDIHSWARGVGGLHALAVYGISDTASPASILAAGVPVARIDGQVASSELWRKLFDDRLAEAATRRTPDLITT